MDRETAIQRAMKYCAEAEHCTQDVVRKLRDWGVDEGDDDSILAVLYREKFVDDARYAKSYVAEKWKLNQWGRIKLKYLLLEKGISEELADDAIASLTEAEYTQGVEEILNQKWKELKEKPDLNTLQKVAVFGAGKGIEEEVILNWMEARVE